MLQMILGQEFLCHLKEALEMHKTTCNSLNSLLQLSNQVQLSHGKS